MKAGRGDNVRLSDMLRSMARLEELLHEGFDEFASDWIRQSAAIRELEIVGEAAGSLSATLRNSHPRIPWREIRGLSSFAKHEYWRIDPSLVWKAIEGVPRIREQVTKVQAPN